MMTDPSQARIDTLVKQYAAPEEEQPSRDLDAVVALMAEDAGEDDLLARLGG